MASDPNVTITFTGSGEGAVKAAQSVGSALDSLAVKSHAARKGLQDVGGVMDSVIARSAKVQQLGAAYQSASVGIHNATVQSQASAAAFTRMAAAAENAKTKVQGLNQSSNQSSKAKPSMPSVGGEDGGGGGMMVLPGMDGSLKGMATMAVQAAGLTIGIGAVGNELRKLITANKDLDTAMSAVAAVGALDKQSAVYQELTATVMKFGAETVFTSTQVAEGLKEVIAAGYSASDATKLLGDTLAIAATENMEMGRAAEIVVATMQSFGFATEESTRVVDVMARAANASTASVDGMGEAMKYLAPVAKAMNIEMEDAAAAVAIMANNGIQAGMAGRGISSLMAKMVGPTKDAQEVIESFGMTVAEINPEVVGMGAAFKALQNLDNAALVKLFGVENLDIANIMSRNASSFDAMVGKMKDTTITAEGMAKLRLDNLTGDLDQMGAALETLRVELGKDLYESLRGHVKSFTVLLTENKDAILDTIRTVGSVAVILGKVALAYAAVKAINFTATLIRQAGGWLAEAAAIRQTTKARIQDTIAKKANAVVMPARDIGELSTRQRGRMMGATRPKGMKTPKAPFNVKDMLGGMKANVGASMTDIFVGGVEGLGPKMGKALGVVGMAATAAVAGWEIGKAIEEHFKLGEKWVNWLYAGEDAANEASNALLVGSAAALANARTDAELAAAKLAIANDLVKAKEKLASVPSGDKAERETAEYTVKVLELRAKSADRTYQKNLAAAAAAKAEADAKIEMEQAERNAAAHAQARALAMRNMQEAAEKMKEALPDIGKELLANKSSKVQLGAYEASQDSAVDAAKELRASLEAELKKNKVNLGMIDPAREIKSVDDVADYFGAIVGAIKKDGNTDLLGLAQVTKLKEIWDAAKEAKAGVKSSGSAVKSEEDAEEAKRREIAKIDTEIAINRAKAAGDTAMVEKLEREQAILEEQLRIFKLLDKPGDADDAAAQAQAKAKATQKVDAEIAANAKPKGGGTAPALSGAAKGVNLLFGRNMNSGLLEEAKKQSIYLQRIANAFGKDNKIPVELVFS